MKFVIAIAASFASAGLVLPTVTQGQTSEIAGKVASAATPSATELRS